MAESIGVILVLLALLWLGRGAGKDDANWFAARDRRRNGVHDD